LELLFGTLNRRLHRGLGHRAERLARIVLVAAQLDPAHTVGARFDSERGDGGVRAERAARKMFAGRAGVGQHGAPAGEGNEQGAKSCTGYKGYMSYMGDEFFHMVW